MTIAVCTCVTFQSVHVVIENASASHMHAILVVSYKGYGASSLATFKGLHGIVNASNVHYRRHTFIKVNVNAVKEMESSFPKRVKRHSTK